MTITQIYHNKSGHSVSFDFYSESLIVSPSDLTTSKKIGLLISTLHFQLSQQIKGETVSVNADNPQKKVTAYIDPKDAGSLAIASVDQRYFEGEGREELLVSLFTALVKKMAVRLPPAVSAFQRNGHSSYPALWHDPLMKHPINSQI